MKKLHSLAFITVLGASATGCAYARSPVTGFVYMNTTAGEGATSNDIGQKKGEACVSSILGWVATGDASITAAAKAGGITKVSHVDSTASDILGVYAEYCTVAYGN
jgi:hypothetical protein